VAIEYFRPNLPVLLLFNFDLNWTTHEQDEVFNVTSQLDNAIKALGYETTLLPVTDSDLDLLLTPYEPRDYIVFNWAESIPGVLHSEHLIAEYLEQKGYTFTGAGSAAIALAQDKIRIKRLLDESGILTPKWQIFNRALSGKWKRFPAIVKASQEHCSEGIDRNSVVMTGAELMDRIGYIREKFRQPALIEDFIDGRELHVSLWENGSIDMLPPAEMEFSMFADEHDRICSYEAKFVPDSEQYQKINTLLPAPLTEQELLEVEGICKAAYVAVGCRDYARIDLRMKDGAFYVIDINPNADISPDTSTVSSAELAGYSYGEFGARIIGLAACRHPALAEDLDDITSATGLNR
jgi:D-alanine-D-alanine ligase